MEINVFTDGGARGNPGPAGYGLVIFEGNTRIYEESKFLGIKTNNEAEYLALIAALKWIYSNKDRYHINQINFHSDSQLLVRQIQGSYKVKSANLTPLFIQAQQLLSQISTPFIFKDIRREYNKIADKLANQAMDQRI